MFPPNSSRQINGVLSETVNEIRRTHQFAYTVRYIGNKQLSDSLTAQLDRWARLLDMIVLGD